MFVRLICIREDFRAFSIRGMSDSPRRRIKKKKKMFCSLPPIECRRVEAAGNKDVDIGGGGVSPGRTGTLWHAAARRVRVAAEAEEEQKVLL